MFKINTSKVKQSQGRIMSFVDYVLHFLIVLHTDGMNTQITIVLHPASYRHCE